MNWNFQDFPYDFDRSSNFLNDLFRSISSDFSDLADLPSRKLSFYGCYPRQTFLRRAVHRTVAQWSQAKMVTWLESNQGFRNSYPDSDLNIWMTFENKRPPHSKFDLTFSFDLDDYGGSNVYFPLIYTYMDMLNNSAPYVRHKITLGKAREPRNSKEVTQKKFACVFMSNPETQRMRVVDALSRIGQVDVYGRVSGNYVQDKIAVSSQYKFQICLENDLYPGYITEKPLEAWLSGTVPIYSGLDSMHILNQNALLNLSEYKNLNALVERVDDLSENDEARLRIINEPLITGNYGLAEIKKQIASRIQAILKNN